MFYLKFDKRAFDVNVLVCGSSLTLNRKDWIVSLRSAFFDTCDGVHFLTFQKQFEVSLSKRDDLGDNKDISSNCDRVMKRSRKVCNDHLNLLNKH